MVGLMVNSSERIYSTRRASQVCFSQSPMAGHCWPVPPEKTLKHSKAGLTQCFVGSPGPGEPKVLFEPSKHLWWVWGLILNAISLLLLSCWGFSLALGWWVSFFTVIPHSPVDGCSAVSCNLGVLAGEDEHTSFDSAILRLKLGFN